MLKLRVLTYGLELRKLEASLAVKFYIINFVNFVYCICYVRVCCFNFIRFCITIAINIVLNVTILQINFK